MTIKIFQVHCLTTFLAYEEPIKAMCLRVWCCPSIREDPEMCSLFWGSTVAFNILLKSLHFSNFCHKKKKFQGK